MSKLGEVYTELIEESLGGIGRHMNKRLMAHAKAVERLAGKEPGVDELQQLFDQGWLPVVGIGEETTVGGSFAAQETRETTLNAEGKVVVGPVQIGGNLASKRATTEQTNVQVSTTLRIVDVSEAYGRLLQNFRGLTPNGADQG